MDGSGHDYASNDELCHYKQSFVFSMPFLELLSIFTQLVGHLQILVGGRSVEIWKKEN